MTRPEPGSRKGLALALLAGAQFIVVLDASIVNVALPSIGKDLHFSQENLNWVLNAYTLVFGGFLLLGVPHANSRTQDLMTAARGNPRELPTALTEGFQNAFMVGAGFAVVGAVLAMVLISSRESREHAEAARGRRRGAAAGVGMASANCELRTAHRGNRVIRRRGGDGGVED